MVRLPEKKQQKTKKKKKKKKKQQQKKEKKKKKKKKENNNFKMSSAVIYSPSTGRTINNSQRHFKIVLNVFFGDIELNGILIDCVWV